MKPIFRSNSTRLAILLLVFCTAALGCNPVRARKAAYVTTGTVLRTEHVFFTPTTRAYVNDKGERVTREPGSEEWRLYYVIDSFDALDTGERTSAVRAEQERSRAFGPRFTYEYRDSFARLRPGEKLTVAYQYKGRGKITVLSVGEQ